jgi:peptide methionine sulfoxide reductase MsrA
MFQDLKGVKDVESGYSGGFVENPEYKEVKAGKTGHA